MASRSRTTFKKRQKELARLDKQRDKAAKRLQRKLEKQTGHATEEPYGDAVAEGDAEVEPATPPAEVQ